MTQLFTLRCRLLDKGGTKRPFNNFILHLVGYKSGYLPILILQSNYFAKNRSQPEYLNGVQVQSFKDLNRSNIFKAGEKHYKCP